MQVGVFLYSGIIIVMKKLIRSFRWAINGICTVWREEANFRIEVTVIVIIVALGAWLQFSQLEWIIIVGCISAVLAAEMVNTAVEDLCNKVEPKTDPIIGKIKDIMAGFVLTVSLGATIVGVILFSNYF